MASNILNTQAQFPNIDQLSKNERGMFMKEHEFETSLQTMISELNSLLDTSSSSDSAIEVNSSKVQAELNVLVGRIESEIVSLVGRYVEQIGEEINQVESAYERLYSKIYGIIQGINVNIQNRTITYDIVMSYKLRILNEIEKMFGIKSPYSDGRSEEPGERYTIQAPGSVIRLRDVDEGIAWRSMPVIIDPNITQDKTVKICEFTPVRNKTYNPDNLENYVPTFLAEINISGDLYAFKGIVKSVTQDRGARFNDSENRSVLFVADYFINQDLPFAIKVLYDSERDKVAIALKYDETDDGFTSIIKFDFSINLLVGTDLEFANESTCVIMDGAGLHSYPITINAGNHIILGEYPSSITHGGSIATYFSAGEKAKLSSSYNVGDETINFEYIDSGYMFDVTDIKLITIGKNVVNTEDISVVSEVGKTVVKINNPSIYGQVGSIIEADIILSARYKLDTRTGNRLYKVYEEYSLPNLETNPSKLIITVNGANFASNNYDFDMNSGLLQVNNITGELVAELSATVTVSETLISE